MGARARMEGKIALVTAAGQGIGKASAIAMAQEGARVFASDINEKTLAELAAQHSELTTLVMDVRDGVSVTREITNIKPDVLLNCAGFVHHGDIFDCTDDEWDFAFDLNVRSMFRTIRAALPTMLERGNGSIINIASVASSVAGVPKRFVYGTSKAAVIGLTKSVAKDYVTTGVRCNAICPGTVDSPSLHDRLRATGDYDKAMEAFIARQPMQRLGTAEEMAALVVHLASDESRFTTGQVHLVDGGWTG